MPFMKKRTTKKVYRKKAKTAKLTKPMAKAVKQIVRGEAETKKVSFFQSANDGTVVAAATGLFVNRGWAVQNNRIVNNQTDILQLIPFVEQGTDDWQRVGKSITVQSLKVQGTIRVAAAISGNAGGAIPANITVYIYVLQHQSLKDYASLRARNDFTQLIDANGLTATHGFNGEASDPQQTIAKNYYKLVKRKKVVLKYAGVFGPIANQFPVSIANAHEWFMDYSMDLTKALPKKLVYPEDLQVGPNPYIESPLNSSLFMCMGFVDHLVPNYGQQPVVPILPWLEQTYVSTMTYKDM